MKSILLSSAAAFALLAAMPAWAGQGSPGDDVAVISQVGETNGQASQNQPGYALNQAHITQTNGTNDVATQDQYRNTTGIDYAVGANATITQTSNTHAVAYQGDNSINGTQTVLQSNNNNVSVNQQLNTPLNDGGNPNSQLATQNGSSNASSITQLVGDANSSGSSTASGNSQSADQESQVGSTILQVADSTSNNNTQVSNQLGGGTGNTQQNLVYNGNSNTLTQNQFGSSNIQVAEVLNGNSNTITQLQAAGASGDSQSAFVSGNGNNVSQSQLGGQTTSGQSVGILGNLNNVIQTQNGGSNDSQVVNIASDSGWALQNQQGAVGGFQLINQLGGGNGNEAGQFQGSLITAGSSQTINQTGGSGNAAVQNMGGAPVYSISGGHVAPHT